MQSFVSSNFLEQKNFNNADINLQGINKVLKVCE